MILLRIRSAVASAAVGGGLLALLHSTLVHSPSFTLATYRRVSGMLSAVDPGHYAPGVAVASARMGLRNELVDRPWSYLPLLVLPVLAALALTLLPGVRHHGAHWRRRRWSGGLRGAIDAVDVREADLGRCLLYTSDAADE